MHVSAEMMDGMMDDVPSDQLAKLCEGLERVVLYHMRYHMRSYTGLIVALTKYPNLHMLDLSGQWVLGCLSSVRWGAGFGRIMCTD